MKAGTICLISLLAASNICAEPEREITLKSSDNKAFKVKISVAQKSESIKNMIHDIDSKDVTEIPIALDGETLGRMVEIMKFVTEYPDQPVSSKNWTELSIRELVNIIKANDFLHVQGKRPEEVSNAISKFYGDRIFGDVELAKIGNMKSSDDYAVYRKHYLQVNRDLWPSIIGQSMRSIDRIFLDTSRDRRINAIKETPLEVAQIIAYIAKQQTAKTADLPKFMREVLEQWQGSNFGWIHFGPWPTEIASWPSHCPLNNHPDYDMYSDGTPNERYIDNGDGTVSDVCTKLIWEQKPPAEKETSLQKGKDRCAKLNNKLLSDWRVPTRIELQSIVDYTVTPALNGIFKEGNAGSGRFWSSTPSAKNRYWLVNFHIGEVQDISDFGHTRCVRGEKGGPQSVGAQRHYAYHPNDETVIDVFTGTRWQRQVADEKKVTSVAAVGALGYCTSLTLDQKPWLLPTVKQLSTLIAMGDAPRIDWAAFPETPKGWFWSRTVWVRNNHYGWQIGFSNGIVEVVHFTSSQWVRCVR